MFSEFLTELKQKEIDISFSGGKIIYSGPEQYLDYQLIENIKKYKGKLIKHLWPPECTNMLPINTEGSKTPFIFVHGQKANYVLSEYLGKDQPVYGFFHYGSSGEKITFNNINLLAENYIAQIQKVLPDGPYLLGGFSFGGTLAFEIAIQLQKSGYNVPLLVLIDSVSPLAREPFRRYNNFFKIIKYKFLVPFALQVLRIVELSVCISFIKTNKPIPIKLRPFYIVDKYKKLTRKYQPEKFDGDILLFRASENKSSFKYMGWETLVNGIKLFHIDGKHLTLYSKIEIYALIKADIQKVTASMKS